MYTLTWCKQINTLLQFQQGPTEGISILKEATILINSLSNCKVCGFNYPGNMLINLRMRKVAAQKTTKSHININQPK